MVDFIDVLVRDVKKSIDKGYYEVTVQSTTTFVSLKKAILECKHAPIIAEVKVASPSLGVIRENADVEKIAMAMQNGGATGISVLTEPKHFKGSLSSFIKIRERVKLPLIMKDVIISKTQLEAASRNGANAVLLIEALFKRGYCECDIHSMIAYAHSRNLEVLLEAHTEDEFLLALNTDADLIGINNRNLETLKVNLETTKGILQKIDSPEKIIVSESGIKTPTDIRFLHEQGVHAFLIGSAIMASNDIEKKVREFVSAYGKG